MQVLGCHLLTRMLCHGGWLQEEVIGCMDLDNDGAVGPDEFKSWWKTPKLVRDAVYSPSADAANAQEFVHLYELPVSYVSSRRSVAP